MDRFYKIGFFVLIFLVAVGASVFIGMRLSNKSSVKTSPTPAPTLSDQDVTVEVTEEPTGVSSHDRSAIEETIRSSIDSKNTAALEAHMADTVNVTIESSECCGSMSKSDAIAKMDYLKDAKSPWNFDQSNETVKKLKSSDPADYGPDSTYVGIASNEYVGAFKFNAQNEITGVTMAVTYKLVLQ